jgi:hypothetical protein
LAMSGQQQVGELAMQTWDALFGARDRVAAE